MKILIYQDDTLNLDLDTLAAGLSVASGNNLAVAKGSAKFKIPTDSFRPTSYEQLAPEFLTEVKNADFSFCFTRIPYDNNYFYHAKGKVVVVSFYAWEQLTTLPIENGAVYFVASVFRFYLPLPSAHQELTGCINDFLWNKSGIDLGMRSGALCATCMEHVYQHKFQDGTRQLLETIKRLLHDLGVASRNEESVFEYWRRGEISGPMDAVNKFGVFLCHNSKEKAEVKKINVVLKTYKVRTWLDEEQLRPGLAWQVLLEEQIRNISSAAVFVGKSGVGPWQDMEIRAFLSEFVRRKCPVIPVILSSAATVPELPIFLRQMTWVDFREGANEAMARLVWGITGQRPPQSARKQKPRAARARRQR